MKAFIFNSGSGSRMGDLTRNNPKALVKLSNGETILGRQIRLLKKAGIKHIIISTGPFEDQIIALTSKFKDIKFDFVNNPMFRETNSIYSLYLSNHLIDDDMIVLHGDLVFDSKIVSDLINDTRKDLCLINMLAKQPEKDFKGRIIDSYLKEISVNIFDGNCYALQPLYKFSYETMKNWLREISIFVQENNIKVYAENALNFILKETRVNFLDYNSYYVEEIDNLEDLIRVSDTFREFDYKNQEIVYNHDYLSEIRNYIYKNNLKKPLIVHGKHFLSDATFEQFLNQSKFPNFFEYSPNPKYEEVLNGLNAFKKNNCDSIIGIGGGSCIDVAKAIKLYSIHNEDYINQESTYVLLPFIALPTTAGTGTESTRYSVIYYNGEKQSLVNDSLLPDLVILNEEFLFNIPEYHKKSSLLDAFCQAIESFWSVKSNDISKQYSTEAIRLILDNYEEYLRSNRDVYFNIMKASNFAGKAINISETTAPHAMSYKLTTLTGIAHGHAVSIILPSVAKFIHNNIQFCSDIRGISYLSDTMIQLSIILNTDVKNISLRLRSIMSAFSMEVPTVSLKLINELAESVNQNRLKNTPVIITQDSIYKIYSESLKKLV